MKGNSLANLSNFKKIYFSLNTFSILNVYKKLDPFSEMKKENNLSEKLSGAEIFNLIAVRTAVMIFSAVLCTVMDLLFGVIPVAVVIYSVLAKQEKSGLLRTAAATSVFAVVLVAVAVHFITISSISVVSVILWIVIMHAAAYAAVRKKYHKITFKFAES